MPTRCHKIREHTHRRRHHRHHINTMEIINELAQVDRQVVAEQAVVQAAMQIITIDRTGTFKNARFVTAQKRHKDFIRC